MSKTTHYVIICDYALADSRNIVGEGITVSSVQHSREDAIKKLAEIVEDDRAYANAQGWIIHEDSETEFDAGESGMYLSNHAHFFISEVRG